MSQRVVVARRSSGLEPLIGIGLAVALIVASGHHVLPTSAGGNHSSAAAAPDGSAAAKAIAFAKAQLGCPYVYGGTGPCQAGYDCSGLVQAAWAAAGVSIPRTSEKQWAQLPHVTDPQPGDLMFYTGSPIDPPPGHVTLYLGNGLMLEAYGAGVPVRITAIRPGAWGYARPG